MGHTYNLQCRYRIAGNFRAVKYSLFLWAGWPPRNFNVGVAYRNVGMPCSHETKRNFYSRKPPFLELNDFLPHETYPLYGSKLNSDMTAGFHLGLKFGGAGLGTRKHAATYLATPTFVITTPYYMLVHHSWSSNVLLIIDSTNVMIFYNVWGSWASGGGGRFTPVIQLLA